MRLRANSGFTLVEIAVTLAAFSFIMVFALGMIGDMSRATLKNSQLSRTQADMRIALDVVEADLRAAGAEIDYSSGQDRFVYADGQQMVFNANLFPAVDDGTGFPQALRFDSSGAGVPSDASAIYVPTASYGTGAETVYLGLDSSGDGIVNGADKADDLEEDTTNPNDYVLYRGVFGWDGASNDADMRPVALVRGPEANSDGVRPQPLFAYFIDHDDDRATAARLHGDADGDGELSQGEIGGLTPLNDGQLARIVSVRVSVTGETASPDGMLEQNDGYNSTMMSSEITIRQRPGTTAVVYGVVWKDLNSDGMRAPSEPAIADAVIQSSSGHQTKTRGDGTYRLDLPPGQQLITEIDPTGYMSTTSNTVTLDLHPGEYKELSFGDNIGSGTGTVRGIVFADVNEDGVQDGDEVGIAGVKIFADGGEYAYTTDGGSYSIDVPLGNRTITEIDPEGFLSTTPNAVDVVLSMPGEVSYVNFADNEAKETGTIQGYVFQDQNQNQVWDSGEGGVLGATIVISGQSTETDGGGFFSLTVATGTHDVIEQDPPGFTSSTPNTLQNIKVDVDQVVTVYFGDIIEEDVNFDVIELADTERALSITSGNMGEDNKGDMDLVLGTRFAGGSNNLLVWHNARRNHTTPNSAIFNSTPTYSRPNQADVTALSMVQIDGASGEDLVAGLTDAPVPLLNVWITDGGDLDNSANKFLATSGGRGVMDAELADINGDGNLDILAGVSDADLVGHFEVWMGDGAGEFSLDGGHIYRFGAGALARSLGEVSSVAIGDVNGDGMLDVAVSSQEGFAASAVNVYLQASGGGFSLKPHQAFAVRGQINSISLLDMFEDDQADLDLLIATEHQPTLGGVELWHQEKDGRFGLVTEAGRAMNDWMPTSGAPVSMITGHVDNDIFPDLIVGTRIDDVGYRGVVQLARSFGHLPTAPTTVSDGSIGVVMTMTGNDFNLDNVFDFAAGTQNSASTGTVYVFYRK